MKKLIGYMFAFGIGVGAIAFEMMESINFWSIAFTPDKWYFAYLGFFLTSVAMIGYFYEFLYTAVGKTQKTVAIVMTFVCAVGSLLTAGVGFQITSYAAGGFEFTKSDYAYMALIVQALIGLHLIALFIYYGGDAIARAWVDEDGDGIPDILQRKAQQPSIYSADISAPSRDANIPSQDVTTLLARIEQLEKANPTPAERKS